MVLERQLAIFTFFSSLLLLQLLQLQQRKPQVEPTVSGFKIHFCFRAKYLTAANGASRCIYTHVHGTENELGKTRKCCYIVSFNPVVQVFVIIKSNREQGNGRSQTWEETETPSFKGRQGWRVVTQRFFLEILDLPLVRDNRGSCSRNDECRIFLPIFTLVV